MEDVGVWEGLDWRWRLQWRRDRFEWESEMEANFIECIARATLKRNMNDIQVWGLRVTLSIKHTNAYLSKLEVSILLLLSSFGKLKHFLMC